MPSCSSSDLKLAMARSALLGATAQARPGRCWREEYCAEVAAGRPRCPPGRCRAGGAEHARIPCPDHERHGVDEVPFGRVSPAAAGRPKKAGPARKPRAKARARAKAPVRPARPKPAKRRR